MKKNLLILGSSSFIGNVLYKNLCSEYNISDHNSKICNFLNPKEVREFSTKFDDNIKVLFTLSLRPKSIIDLDKMKKNYKMIENFIKFFTKKKNLKIIFFSTIDVYINNKNQIINEETQVYNNNFYAQSKILSENLLKKKINNQKLTIFRLPGVYGPGDNYQSAIGQMVKSAIKKNKIILNSNNLKRDYLYVDDLVKITKFFLNNNAFGVYNLVKGKSETIGVTAKHIQSLINCNIETVNSLNKKNQYDLIFDNYKIKKIIRKIIFTSTKNGIQKYIKFL